MCRVRGLFPLPTPPSTRADEIRELFQHLTWQGRHLLARRLASLDLTVPQYHVLKMLDRLGPSAKMSDVSDALQMPRSSMTSITDRLVELGLAQRASHEWDRRVVMASITPKGSALVRRIEAANRETLRNALAGRSEADIDHFAGMLRALVEGIERDMDEPAAPAPAGRLEGAGERPAGVVT